MLIFAAAAAFALIPTLAEVVKRRRTLAPELLRKAVHIAGGLLAAPLPWLLPYRQIAILAGAFVVLMMLSRLARVFTVVHEVDRDSYGEVLFPAGVVLLAALRPHPWVFADAMLVLALADTAAAAVGMRLGRRKLPLGGKTVVGSVAFFVTSFALGMAVVGPVRGAIVATAATAAEACLGRGFDNLVLPPLVAVALVVV